MRLDEYNKLYFFVLNWITYYSHGIEFRPRRQMRGIKLNQMEECKESAPEFNN